MGTHAASLHECIPLLSVVPQPGLVSYFIFTKYRQFEAAQRRQNQRILSDLIKGNGVGREDFIQFTKFQVPHCMPQSLS